jgi:hypothetical protein
VTAKRNTVTPQTIYLDDDNYDLSWSEVEEFAQQGGQIVADGKSVVLQFDGPLRDMPTDVTDEFRRIRQSCGMRWKHAAPMMFINRSYVTVRGPGCLQCSSSPCLCRMPVCQ